MFARFESFGQNLFQGLNEIDFAGVFCTLYFLQLFLHFTILQGNVFAFHKIARQLFLHFIILQTSFAFHNITGQLFCISTKGMGIGACGFEHGQCLNEIKNFLKQLLALKRAFLFAGTFTTLLSPVRR